MNKQQIVEILKKHESHQEQEGWGFMAVVDTMYETVADEMLALLAQPEGGWPQFGKLISIKSEGVEIVDEAGTFAPAQQIWKDWMMSHARSIGMEFEDWFKARYAEYSEDEYKPMHDPDAEALRKWHEGYTDISDAAWPTADPFKTTVIYPEVFAGKKLSDILVHEDDCQCRTCQPNLWYEIDGVWTHKFEGRKVTKRPGGFTIQSLGDEVI